MKRQFVTLLAAFIVITQGGCGGGGGDGGGTNVAPPSTIPTPPAGVNVARSIGGLWFGGLSWPASAPSPAGSTVARVLVAETGEFRIVMTSDRNWEQETLFSNESEQIFGTFGYSGSNVITKGAAVATMPLGANNASGDYFGDFGMSGRFDSLTNFSGTFVSGYTNFLERLGTIAFTYHSIYERPSSLALLSGTFTTATSSLSIDSQGAIFFQSSATGCTGDGHAETIDTRYNMYRLTISIGSCTGINAVRNGLTFTGLANLGVNNDLGGGFINETLEMALSAINGTVGYISWNHLAHRR